MDPNGKMRNLYELANDDLLTQALYREPTRLASKIAPNGSISVNTDWENKMPGAKMFIEQQRYGGDLVTAGLYASDEQVIRQGLTIIEWGFARQGEEGNFPDTGDPFHSTGLFLEGASRGILLLKQSEKTAYADIVSGYVPKLAAAARWMLKPGIAAPGGKNNAPYSHRRFEDAAALGMITELTGDAEMAKAAEAYAREGISLITPEGVFPEKGGEDASYQSVGMLFAARYYLTCKDAELRRQLKETIHKGMERVAGHIDEKGNVVLYNSRVGIETGRSGEIKNFDYKVMLQALVLAGKITGDEKLQEKAKVVALGRKWIK